MINKIKTLRKTLHQHPEPSGQETNTAIRIRQFIQNNYNTKIIEGIGGTGLAAVYEFSNDGPTIMIRCELDALPIAEPNSFAHKSINEGVSHKCGHDGHMAIVAGLIFEIKKQNFQKGKIVLLFQPAEENGEGAHAVINDPKFDSIQPDFVFALHNIPGEAMHSIITVNNRFSATVQSLAIYLKGKEAHASEPENGINPALAIAEITRSFSQLNVSDPFKENFTLLTPVHIKMGQQAYGISAGSGELHFTFRTWTTANMNVLKDQSIKIIEDVCTQHKLSFSTAWFDYFPTAENDDYCNEVITSAALKNGLTIIEKPFPFRFGEDFGWFAQNYRSAMFGLGAGINTPALHHVDYDFPDEILPTGIDMFMGILSDILRN